MNHRSRRAWIAALFFVAGTASLVWAEPEVSNQELRESVRLLDVKKLREVRARGVDPARILKQHPKEAIPLLVAATLDTSLDEGYRDTCLCLLSQDEMKANLSPANYRQILTIVKDANAWALLRIHAGGIILRQYKALPKEMRLSIKEMALGLVAADKIVGQVYNLVLSHYTGDIEVEDLLLKRLETDKDKNAAILVLGKVRSIHALNRIIELLDSDEAGKSFYKVRAYLAIGDIGGDRAFDYLERYQPKEKYTSDAAAIFTAMARTRTERGRKMLLARITDHSAIDLAVLDGIKIGGGPEFIPILEKELKKPKNAANKAAIERVLVALRLGDDSTIW
jgi:hypothetical protein